MTAAAVVLGPAATGKPVLACNDDDESSSRMWPEFLPLQQLNNDDIVLFQTTNAASARRLSSQKLWKQQLSIWVDLDRENCFNSKSR